VISRSEEANQPRKNFGYWREASFALAMGWRLGMCSGPFLSDRCRRASRPLETVAIDRNRPIVLKNSNFRVDHD
jgi:hypothetical protein